MLNQVVVVGRIAKDLEIKELENGKKQSVVTIAVPRSYKNIDGEYDTDFFEVILWEGIANNVFEYCHQGDLIGIKGKLQSRTIEIDEETEKYVLELVAEKVTFLSSKTPTKDNPAGSNLYNYKADENSEE